MLTIIHGEDIKNSRDFYLEEKRKNKNPITLDGTTLMLTDLLQALSGLDLFANNQTIFIDELFSKRKPSKELDAIAEIVKKTESSVYLWESKDLTPKQLSNFKQATVKQFKLPAVIFTFVDSLALGNGRKLTQLYHELLQTEDATFALVMLQRQIRLLLAIHPQSIVIPDLIGDPEKDSRLRENDANSTISEVKRLAPWQKGKLQKQAKLFTTEQLIDLHTKLYELELGQKTGKLSLPLEQSFDFFLASI